MSDSRPPETMKQDPAVAASTLSPQEGNTGQPTAPGRPAVDKIPRIFGRYRLQECLGKGGMGAVFKAHDTQLDRVVALKVPFLNNNDSDTLQRFYREARSAATLQHANICPVFDVGEFQGIPYLTMAFIEGQTLDRALEAGQILSPMQVGMLVRKVALAMQEAHSRGVIHRDLKPSNVLLRPNNEPVIMDFGLARRNDDEKSEGLTRQGDIIGTLEYMSPEQIDGDNANVGPSADIYALGVVLYEMLTGRRPFTGTTTAKLAAIMLKPPVPPSEVRPGVPAKLEEICLKAMAKKPGQRYATMSQFAAALTEFLRSPQQVASSGVVGTAPTRVPMEAPATPRPGNTQPIPENIASKESGRSASASPTAPSGAKTPGPPSAVKLSSPGVKEPSSRRSRSGARKKKSQAEKQSHKPIVLVSAILGGVGLLTVILGLIFSGGSKKDPGFVQTPTPSQPSNPPAKNTGSQPSSKGSTTSKDSSKQSKQSPQASGKNDKNGKQSPVPPPARPEFVIHPPPQAVPLLVGEPQNVSVNVERKGGYQGPVELRWQGSKELRVTPAGPVTLQPGQSKLDLTLQINNEPSAADLNVAITATAKYQKDEVTAQSQVQVRAVPGPCVCVVKVDDQPTTSAMAFTPDTNLVLIGSSSPGKPGKDGKPGPDEHTIRVWNLTRNEVIHSFTEATSEVLELVVSADSKRAMSRGKDDVISLWDLAAGKRSYHSPKPPLHLQSVTMSPDAKWALVTYAGMNGLITRVDLDKSLPAGVPIKTSQLSRTFDEGIRTVALSGDRKGLVGGLDGKLFLIDMSSAKAQSKPQPLTAHRETVLCSAFAATDRLAATGGGGVLQAGQVQPGKDNAVCLWDIPATTATAPSLKWKADDHKGSVVRVAFSPNGKFVASGGSDGEVRVWSVDDGKSVATFTGHKGAVLALVFSQDGKKLWSGSKDQTVREWRLP